MARRFATAERGTYETTNEPGTEGGENLLILVVLALLAIIAFGVGFTVHWLFIVAVIAALIWLISLFLGGARGRTRGAWW